VKSTFVLNSQSIVSAGGGQPHTNIMPCTGVNFIIALQGMYPNFQ
jgi:microcystin-dependent protein